MDHGRESLSGDERPQKRQRVLACRRCRGRKQKCEDKRPCSNCVKSGDECLPTEPAPRPHVEGEYVKALEERIAELESRDTHDHAYDQSQSSQGLNHIQNQSHQAHQAHHDHMHQTGSSNDASSTLPRRRLTQSSGHAGSAGRSSVAYRDATAHRKGPEGIDTVYSAEGNSVSPANHSQARKSYSQHSPAGAISLGDDSDSGFDHLVYGLVTSPSARDEGILMGSGKSPSLLAPSHDDAEFLPHSLIAAMPPEIEDLLLGAYRGRAQIQYPFFNWTTFMAWHSDWKHCPPSELSARSWQGFFVNLVYSTALLLLSLPRVGQSDSRTFYKNAVSLLPHVFRHPDEMLHVQAYLLLSIHAVHRSSTPRILSLASTTMRLCVQKQLHLHETEPRSDTTENRLSNQLRRRCFWSAYCIERMIVASFELPPSIPDVMITARLYANIDDEDLEDVAARTPPDSELPDMPVYTCVSSSLHILQCRRIQSEIAGYTLRWDYQENYENSVEWRMRILNELENYKSRVQNFSDPHSKGHASHRWLAMIYHYTLLLLYRPNKDNVLGPAGDWAIQASSQACLMFRKSQMDRQIAQAWIGLLVQFQSGVTLLYCCWATPPEFRTENYDSPDVSDALRACSNILAIMADRWPKADCLRDVFELLAREVPLVDRPSRPPTRISESSAAIIREKLPQIRSLIVLRSISRMIEEMVNEDFPRLRGNQSPQHFASQRATPARDRPPPAIVNRPLATASPGPITFELPFTAPQMYGSDGNGLGNAAISADELLAFPGMFDLEGWS